MKNHWNNFYKKKDGNNFPHQSIIRFFYRKFSKKKKNLFFLDLGAGTGSSLKIFDRNNIYLDLLDNSSSAVKKLKNKSRYKKKICVYKSRFNEFLEKNNRKYDLIIDSQSLQHQGLKETIISYKHIYDNLKKGGYFLTIHMNSFKLMNEKFFRVYTLSEKKIKNFIRKFFKNFEYNIEYYTEDNKKKFIKYNIVIAKK